MNKMFFIVYALIPSSVMLCYTADSIASVDFLQSMVQVGKYDEPSIPLERTLESFENYSMFKMLYNKHIFDRRKYTEQPSIPKIIHHVWLGSPLPEKYKKYRETWKQFHPTWLCILWDDEKVEQLRLVNKHFYDAATNYGEKSDIARYEILYRFGGVYADTDFQCLQPFDELHHLCDFYVGCYPCVGQTFCTLFNGLFAAAPGHPIVKRCIDSMSRGNHAANDPTSIMQRTGPGYLTRCFRASVEADDAIGRCVPFPATFFYPFPGICRYNKKSEFVRSFICKESLAIHHWAGSWLT